MKDNLGTCIWLVDLLCHGTAVWAYFMFQIKPWTFSDPIPISLKKRQLQIPRTRETLDSFYRLEVWILKNVHGMAYCGSWTILCHRTNAYVEDIAHVFYSWYDASLVIVMGCFLPLVETLSAFKAAGASVRLLQAAGIICTIIIMIIHVTENTNWPLKLWHCFELQRTNPQVYQFQTEWRRIVSTCGKGRPPVINHGSSKCKHESLSHESPLLTTVPMIGFASFRDITSAPPRVLSCQPSPWWQKIAANAEWKMGGMKILTWKGSDSSKYSLKNSKMCLSLNLLIKKSYKSIAIIQDN